MTVGNSQHEYVVASALREAVSWQRRVSREDYCFTVHLVTSDIICPIIVEVGPWKTIFQENNFVHTILRGENHAKQSCCARQGKKGQG